MSVCSVVHMQLSIEASRTHSHLTEKENKSKPFLAQSYLKSDYILLMNVEYAGTMDM
jgi:hypothetical protein